MENWTFGLVFAEDSSQLAASPVRMNLIPWGFIHFPGGIGAFILLDLE